MTYLAMMISESDGFVNSVNNIDEKMMYHPDCFRNAFLSTMFPLTVIDPDRSGESILPARTSRRVDLPAPELPITASNLPGLADPFMGNSKVFSSPFSGFTARDRPLHESVKPCPNSSSYLSFSNSLVDTSSVMFANCV